MRSLPDLKKRAAQEYRLVVDDILRAGSGDAEHIEHALDRALDFCHFEPMLALCKRRCRHYWLIDPAATAEYVHAYRETWDDDEDEGQE